MYTSIYTLVCIILHYHFILKKYEAKANGEMKWLGQGCGGEEWGNMKIRVLGAFIRNFCKVFKVIMKGKFLISHNLSPPSLDLLLLSHSLALFLPLHLLLLSPIAVPAGDSR